MSLLCCLPICHPFKFQFFQFLSSAVYHSATNSNFNFFSVSPHLSATATHSNFNFSVPLLICLPLCHPHKFRFFQCLSSSVCHSATHSNFDFFSVSPLLSATLPPIQISIFPVSLLCCLPPIQISIFLASFLCYLLLCRHLAAAATLLPPPCRAIIALLLPPRWQHRAATPALKLLPMRRQILPHSLKILDISYNRTTSQPPKPYCLVLAATSIFQSLRKQIEDVWIQGICSLEICFQTFVLWILISMRDHYTKVKNLDFLNVSLLRFQCQRTLCYISEVHFKDIFNFIASEARNFN